MSIKIPRPLFFLLAYSFTFFLYWPLLNGSPIWDDYNFWIVDPIIDPSITYEIIWFRYVWPFSVSAQKLIYQIWERNFFYYHLLNFTIHCLNSFLVYKLGQRLRFKYHFLYFLLFLLHPVAVISAGWMIQIKTLLCFFFAISALLIVMKEKVRLSWMAFAWILFFLSVTSKSASIFLPLIFFLIHYKLHRLHKIHYLIPFFLLSIWSGHRLISSPTTANASATASKVIEETIEAPKASDVKTIEKKDEIRDIEEKMDINTPLPAPVEIPDEEELIRKDPEKTILSFASLNITLVLQTSYYYFWQSIFPVNTTPVRGLNYEKLGPEEIIHCLFLGIIVFLLWKDMALIPLIAGYALLVPFLGIIPAPFMNVTWVSDQHLYLVLPAFLAVWVRLLEKIPWRYNFLLLVGILFFYAHKTYKTTPIYKSEITFYKNALEYNPYNVPMSYNLAFVYLLNGQWANAYYVVSDAYHLSKNEPQMRKNVFYPHLYQLYLKMVKGLKGNEN